MLIDIGLNLTHDSFDRDRERVISDARDAGVGGFIITGTDVAGSRAALALAERHDDFFATAGVHPHHATGLDETAVAELRELLAHPKVIAVGECGLDFFRNFSSRDAQLAAFRAQLELAAETGKPLFLHQRDAHDELMALLQEFADQLPQRGVVHCFTDGPRELEDVLEAGYCVGITGWLCDERRGSALREATARLPLDRFMLETDAPYLLPRDLPKDTRDALRNRNEPRFLPHIAARLAEILGIPPEEVVRRSTENARRVFGLPG
ncbi:MAG TPA: TatD family hydrolase [Gammaproteobacteria bacterium]|nr:TatD family hydrolase [Gammaproteobacteria bacterium]